MNNQSIRVRTPAKLILSGEHAVVHGFPAITLAVNRYIEVTARWTLPLRFSFNLMGLDFKRQVTLRALNRLKHKLEKQYEKFNLGQISIREVLQHPFELSLFTVINVLHRLKNKLPMGIDIASHSNIPSGSGMGSSAASVVSLIYALSKLIDIEFDIEDYITLGIQSENLQHGYSSGLDVYTVYHGGCLRYQQNMRQSRDIFEFPMQLVQTGQPQSTTGECVTHASQYFKNTSIGADFEAVTNQLDAALQLKNIDTMKHCVRANQKLLQTLEVVPDKVQAFIKDIELLGGAAKICGAGSIRGDRAGVIWVLNEHDVSELAEKYGYQASFIHVDTKGTHVIPC